MVLALTGKRYGRWTVLGRAERRCRWHCRCDCGTERPVISSDLRSGASASCGCIRPDGAIHGHARLGKFTAEYRAWSSMKTRCTNPRQDFWHRYGGRGIRVDRRWSESFEAFLADVGRRPSPAHSLDRFPDTDGDYEPGNVRWATVEQQANNRTTNRFIEHCGERMTLVQWARRIGINQTSLRERIDRHGVARALSMQPRRRAS